MWVLVYRHKTTGELSLIGEESPTLGTSWYENSPAWQLAGRTKFVWFDEGDNELPTTEEGDVNVSHKS